MKTFLISIFLLFSILASNAQYYKYAHLYDQKQYEYMPGDKYNPTVAGVLAVIPGLGHIYSGQIIRGLLFPAGMLASAFIVSAASWSTYMNSSSSSTANAGVIVGTLGFVGLYTLNFFDAVKVAQIKNLHLRDNAVSFQISPYLGNQMNEQMLGFSLKMRF